MGNREFKVTHTKPEGGSARAIVHTPDAKAAREAAVALGIPAQRITRIEQQTR